MREFDVVGVGAGFSGLYLLHRLRGLGFSCRIFDGAEGVGGTWYWNRYPGARCDITTLDYSYSFDPALDDEWQWSEKYATQPEILEYLNFVADRYDLRPDIEFSTRIESAQWDGASERWLLRTSGGEEVACRYYVMATGCLSLPKQPEIPGASSFAGEVYFTGKWPHQPVDFTAKRVAVIGTGSSGVQSIPVIARQAAELTVFQRTPNFSVPAHNGAIAPDRLAAFRSDPARYRDEARRSRGGVPLEPADVMGVTTLEDERRERFDAAIEAGELFAILGIFADQMVREESNAIVSDMLRDRIRAIVADPDMAARLCPTDHPFGTKRPCLDSDYYETFNLPHVRLVDVRRDPITAITPAGIDTASESFEFDAIVYATGFDAMTGPIVAVDIRGRDGLSLKEKWKDGPTTYLGLTTTGFPNFFTVTGPGSPSVMSNMVVSIEQHVDWVAQCLADLRGQGFVTIEPTPTAEQAWTQHVQDCAAITLYPKANSWYMGANVPGKPRVFYPYIGGVGSYRAACDEVVDRSYLGFRLAGPDISNRVQCHDGIVRQLQPDVAMVLEFMASLGLPPLEEMGVEGARAAYAMGQVDRPMGPDVGAFRDGTLPGGAGPLSYRLFEPPSLGGGPVVVYFHGGGWVLGDHAADEPFCRDLCARTGLPVLSVDYRHAPEAGFPAAADDADAAVEWVMSGAEAIPGSVAGRDVVVAGWSAGANLAAVVAQRRHDRQRSDSGPGVVAQLLLCPVIDGADTYQSMKENGDGYLLTASLMQWFWDQYAPVDRRRDPAASPIHGRLDGLPPAVIVTAQFDPLRDEGDAYAAALSAAGVPVRHIAARGHIHTSVTLVDVVLSGAPVRAEMAAALAGFVR